MAGFRLTTKLGNIMRNIVVALLLVSTAPLAVLSRQAYAENDLQFECRALGLSGWIIATNRDSGVSEANYMRTIPLNMPYRNQTRQIADRVYHMQGVNPDGVSNTFEHGCMAAGGRDAFLAK